MRSVSSATEAAPAALTDALRWHLGKREFTAAASPALLHEPLVETDPIRVGAQFQNRLNGHGRYYWQRTGTHVWHESVLELRSLELLDFGGEVVRIASQPFEITFRDGSGAVRHTPDFFGVHRDGEQVVYDVKPLGWMTDEVAVQFEQTARVCASIGWTHEVLHERSEMSTMVLTHLRKARHPNACPSADVTEHARSVFEDGRTLAEGRVMLNLRHPVLAMPAIKHLIWHRFLRVDVEQPLSLDSVAHATSKEGPCRCG